MPAAYQNPTEASQGLTAAFNPTTDAQKSAIATASALVPTKTPTVITGANINENVLPDVKSNLAKYTDTPVIGQPTDPNTIRENNGTYTGGDGNQYYTYDSTPVSHDTTLGGGDTSIDDSLASTNKVLAAVKAQTDPATKALLDSISQQFELRKTQQADSNARNEAGMKQSLLLGGSSRYAPISAGGIVSAQESYGIQQIADLDAQEKSAVAQAQAAADANNWRQVDTILAEADKIRTDKRAAAKDLADRVAAANKETRDNQYNRVTKPIQDLATEAAKNNASPEVIKAINAATTVNDAIAAAGNYLQTATGTLGDYLQYQRQAQTAGQTPMTYEAYKDKEDQKAANLAYATEYAKAKGKAAGEASGQPAVPTNATTKPYIDAFNNASLGLTATQLKSAQMSFNDLLGTGDLSGARDTLVRVAVTGLPAADQTVALGRAQALGALQDIQSLMNEASAKSNIPNLFTGGIANAAKRLGVSTDSDLNYIANRIQSELITYRRAMTGVAFSPQETAQYKALFPDITNTDALNAVNIKALSDSLDSNNRATIGFAVGQGNYDKIFGASNTGHLPTSLVQQESQAQNSIVGYLTTHPDKVEEVKSAMTVINPQTGKPLTATEFLEVFPEYAQ